MRDFFIFGSWSPDRDSSESRPPSTEYALVSHPALIPVSVFDVLTCAVLLCCFDQTERAICCGEFFGVLYIAAGVCVGNRTDKGKSLVAFFVGTSTRPRGPWVIFDLIFVACDEPRSCGGK